MTDMKVLRQAQPLIFTYKPATDAVMHYRGSLWFREKKHKSDLLRAKHHRPVQR